MSETVSFAAERRQTLGKGGARATRRAGRVPAIVYGQGQDPLPISVDLVELDKQLHTQGFFTKIFELRVDGRTIRTLARDCQRDPVLGRPLHVDFLSVGATTRVDVDVEVVFANEDECPGLKRGGVLNIVLHQIGLNCRADQIPGSLTVDLAGLDIGDTVHLPDVKLPPGAELAVADPEATVASIAAPTVAPAEEEEEAEEEEAEPELVGKSAEGGEEEE